MRRFEITGLKGTIDSMAIGMKMRDVRVLFSAAVLALVVQWRGSGDGRQESPLYLDTRQPIPARVEDLLGRMTLEEKIGQLNLPCAYVNELGKTPEEKMEAARKFAAGTYTSEIGPGSASLRWAIRSASPMCPAR